MCINVGHTQESHRGGGVCPEAGVKLELELELESSAVQWPEPNLVSTYVACVGNKLFIRVCLLLCFQLLGHIIYFIVFSYFCFLVLCVLFLLPSARFSAVCCLSSAFCFPIFIKQQNIYLLCLKRDETKQNLIALCLLTNCIVRRLEPASPLNLSLSLLFFAKFQLKCTRFAVKETTEKVLHYHFDCLQSFVAITFARVASKFHHFKHCNIALCSL